jgi:hypothetical protein
VPFLNKEERLEIFLRGPELLNFLQQQQQQQQQALARHHRRFVSSAEGAVDFPSLEAVSVW